MKPCAKCGKIVYPTEEFKCLDQMWHRACFKCEMCGMTLNMKNYKGYNKKPYCNAHYPTTKATVVADTPELRRIAENTKVQSNIQYHREFEEQMRGRKISVAEDPELQRTKAVQDTVSNLKYHNVLEHKEDVEARRQSESIEHAPQRVSSGPRYPSGSVPVFNPNMQQEHNPSPYAARQSVTTVYDSTQGGRVEKRGGRQIGSIHDYDPIIDQREAQQRESQKISYGSGVSQLIRPPMQSAPQPVPTYYDPPPQQHVTPASRSSQPPEPRWIALYDYVAADTDEVSFGEGDIIVEGDPIDDGWMMGTVLRTGLHGMLPSNYVQLQQ